MAETRMQPRIVSRSTGIDQTTGVVNRPNNAAGSNATSHVSAAPGVSARAHDHVVNARNPSGVSSARGPATAPPRGRGQDATVQLIERPGSQSGQVSGSAPSQVASVSSVQILGPRPHAGQEQPEDALLVEEIELIGSLVEKYAEGVSAIGDQASAASAQSILRKLARMHGAALAPVAATARPRAQHGAQAPEVVAAQTSTTIVSAPPASARTVPQGHGSTPATSVASAPQVDDEVEVDLGSGHGAA